MTIFGILISLLMNVYPPTSISPQSSGFECDAKQIESIIYNNQNGSYSIVEPLKEIDAGGFVVLKWDDLTLMLPRTFNANETSFTDGKWWWSFENNEPPHLRLRKSNGKIKDFDCQVVPIGLTSKTE